jgi:Spy/CpxP family protein refolding chaperone
MTSYRTLVTSVLLASGLGFAAAPALAEHQDCGNEYHHMDYSKHRMEHMEKHHEKLHAALKLTPEQEGAWTKFTSAEKPMARAESGKPEDWSKLTTPEREDTMLQRMKEQQTRMTEHVLALKEFYAMLTPEQKNTFDKFHSDPHHGKKEKMKHRR